MKNKKQKPFFSIKLNFICMPNIQILLLLQWPKWRLILTRQYLLPCLLFRAVFFSLSLYLMTKQLPINIIIIITFAKGICAEKTIKTTVQTDPGWLVCDKF